MTASACVLRLLPRQLTTPLRLALAPAPSRAASRGYFSFSILQQPHRCFARAAASSASNSSSICEQYPQAPIDATPGAATCPHDEKGEGDREAAARGGEKAAGAQQDDSSGPGASSPRAPKDKEALRAAAAAGRKGRSGAPSRQRVRTAKPQVNKPARPGPPKQGRGDGGGIIHAAPRSSSSSASSTSPSSSSSSTSSTRLRVTKKQESED
jgi:hypothetical protein